MLKDTWFCALVYTSVCLYVTLYTTVYFKDDNNNKNNTNNNSNNNTLMSGKSYGFGLCVCVCKSEWCGVSENTGHWSVNFCVVIWRAWYNNKICNILIVLKKSTLKISFYIVPYAAWYSKLQKYLKFFRRLKNIFWNACPKIFLFLNFPIIYN